MEQSILKRFKEMRGQDRLAHAYLFVGPKGSQKVETALAIAKMLNCQGPDIPEDGFCGQCPACVKITKGNHPDVMVLERGEDASIKIEPIRALISRIQLRAFEAQYKIFILKDAETLTVEAANALLKTLEEPSKDSLLILTSSVIERILPTIRSRCQTVAFFALSSNALAEIMMREGLSKEQAQCLSRFSEGCRGKAYDLWNKEFLKTKNAAIDQFLQGTITDADLKTLASDTQEGKDVLSILMSWCRDIFLLKAGAGEERMVHADRLSDLKRYAAHYTDEHLKEILQTIVRTRKMVDDNFNVKIPLMLLKEQLWGN